MDAVFMMRTTHHRRHIMKSFILWLLGVPIFIIILLNVFGFLGHG